MNMKTFQDCKNDEPATIYEDWQEGDYRCLVMRGPAALCAYIGVKEGHPLYGVDYSRLSFDVHGGLTYASPGEGTLRPAGYWWLGWDYGHYRDACFYDNVYNYDETQWEPDMVKREVSELIQWLSEHPDALTPEPLEAIE
jgi:hypothetical protein